MLPVLDRQGGWNCNVSHHTLLRDASVTVWLCQLASQELSQERLRAVTRAINVECALHRALRATVLTVA